MNQATYIQVCVNGQREKIRYSGKAKRKCKDKNKEKDIKKKEMMYEMTERRSVSGGIFAAEKVQRKRGMT